MSKQAKSRPVIRINDFAEASIDAFNWLGGDGRDQYSDAERRAEQLLFRNESNFRVLSITASTRREGGKPKIVLQTDKHVGAIALVSPNSGKHEYGVYVSPRFDWSIISDWLPIAGFSASPAILGGAMLPTSVSGIPPWVLSSAVVRRVLALLSVSRRQYHQKFELTSHPKGRIDWNVFASQVLPSGRHAVLPCTFPDLDNDITLLSAIKYVAETHRDFLLPFKHKSRAAAHLLATYVSIISSLERVQSVKPRLSKIHEWEAQGVASSILLEGIQAIDWTINNRGLGGLMSLTGLPWKLDMAYYFEAIVAGILQEAARDSSASIQVGLEGQTSRRISWQSNYSSSLKSLVPDAVLQKDDTVLVVDAKYKRHGDLIGRGQWNELSTDIKESHRHDLHQILAYSSLYSKSRIVGCLVYPDNSATPHNFEEIMRKVSRGALSTQNGRSVEIALVPLSLVSKAEDNQQVFQHILRFPL